MDACRGNSECAHFKGNETQTKVYIFKCECSKNRELPKINEILIKRSFNFKIDISPKYLFSNILYEISSDNFYGYSRLLVIFYFECECPVDDLLRALYKAINKNINLIYIRKIILSHAELIFQYEELENESIKRKRLLTLMSFNDSVTVESATKINIIQKVLRKNKHCTSFDNSVLMEFKNMRIFYTINTMKFNNHKKWFIYSDINIFSNCISNANTVLQSLANKLDSSRVETSIRDIEIHKCDSKYKDILRTIYWSLKTIPKTKSKIIFVQACRDGCFHTKNSIDEETDTTDVEDYQVTFDATQRGYVQQKDGSDFIEKFGQILDLPFNEWPVEKLNLHMIKVLQHKIGCVFMTSPSLAITFNNILFKNKDMREASVYDIKRLNYSFTTKYISHLVIMNGNINNIKCVMDFVKTYGFKHLKYLYMTVMSHGNKGGIIYTETDVYNIEEVIFKAVRENRTLRNALLINLINMCRGVIDPRFEDRDLVYEEIDNDGLDENFITFYSAQEGYVSYLEKHGAAFIMAFCDNFNAITTEMSMLAIAQSVENTLQNKMKFSPKVTEYRAKPGVSHIITMELANSNLYTELYEEIYDIVQNCLFVKDNTLSAKVSLL